MMIFLRFLFCIFYIPFLILMLPYMVIRAALTKAHKTTQQKNADLLQADCGLIAQHLSRAIQCDTTSLQNPQTDDGAGFVKLHKLLDELYPVITQNSTKTVINKYSLVYKIEGSDSTLLPACFLAHQDVVPASSEGWDFPPFEGKIIDGYVYGRGAMDMKSLLITLLEAVEALLKLGMPQRTIYLCFGHDEEYPTMCGAPKIVEYLKDQKITMEYIVDEGGLMLDGNLLGIDSIIALIGTCEKGHCDYTITADIDGGHGSMPDNKTALGEVMKASLKIINNPLPAKWTPATKEMINSLAPYSKFGYKIIFANRGLLSPAIKFVLDKASSITRSIVKTTFAPTMAKGANAPNVIPCTASVNINVRNIPGQSIQQVQQHMQKVAGDSVTIKADPAGTDASPISPHNTYSYNELKKAIGETFEDLIVAPYMFPAGTDAKYYYPICNNVFRFTPFVYTEDDRTRIHARNERCEVDSLGKATQFFGALIKNTCY